MNTDTQKPSEHAMRAAKELGGGDIEAYLIDQHAIAPAVAERDKRIAELEKALKVMVAHVKNYVPDIPAGGYIDHDLKLARAILAKHGGS